MVSYSELLETLRRELESEEPRSLPRDYYAEVKEYLNYLVRKAGESKSEVERRIYSREYELAKLIAVKLFLLRVAKFVNAYFKRGEVESSPGLAKEELELLGYLKSTLERLVEVAPPEEGEERGEMVLVSFKSPCSKTMVRGAVLGPFSEGDLAYLPKEVAMALVEQGVAEIVGE